MIEGIGRDKISDLTTNVISRQLAVYTKEQCDLHGVPTTRAPLPPYYDDDTGLWVSDYFDLPTDGNRPILLVPTIAARYDPAYNAGKYYRYFVLNYLKAEHLAADTSLVHTLRNGRKVVYKNELERLLPLTKENLFQFSKDHPTVLEEYRPFLAELERRGAVAPVELEDEPQIANALIAALRTVSPGSAAASEYHRLMVGVLEFLFFPELLHPRKEQEIHQGRKRIDILLENGAIDGIFRRLHEVRGLPCAFVVAECKNYTTEVTNPELDQIAGRFSTNRGKAGLLCCRSFENRAVFIERCRDTLRDGRGLVVPIDDDTIVRWLEMIAAGRRRELDWDFTAAVDEVWVS